MCNWSYCEFVVDTLCTCFDCLQLTLSACATACVLLVTSCFNYLRLTLSLLTIKNIVQFLLWIVRWFLQKINKWMWQVMLYIFAIGVSFLLPVCLEVKWWTINEKSVTNSVHQEVRVAEIAYYMKSAYSIIFLCYLSTNKAFDNFLKDAIGSSLAIGGRRRNNHVRSATPTTVRNNETTIEHAQRAVGSQRNADFNALLDRNSSSNYGSTSNRNDNDEDETRRSQDDAYQPLPGGDTEDHGNDVSITIEQPLENGNPFKRIEQQGFFKWAIVYLVFYMLYLGATMYLYGTFMYESIHNFPTWEHGCAFFIAMIENLFFVIACYCYSMWLLYVRAIADDFIKTAKAESALSIDDAVTRTSMYKGMLERLNKLRKLIGTETKLMCEKFLQFTILFFSLKLLAIVVLAYDEAEPLAKIKNDKIARTNFLLAIRYVPIICIMTWPVMMIESLTNGPESFIESVKELIRNNYLHEDAQEPGYNTFAQLRNARERNIIAGGFISFANLWRLFTYAIFGYATIPRLIVGFQKIIHDPPTNTTIPNQISY